MAMEYDEEAELIRYVWEYCFELMTDVERRVRGAIIGRMKAATCPNPEMSRSLAERWGRVGDPEIDAALAEGAETFRRRVCRRVLADSGSAVFINRCPRCFRVVRTSKAEQCRWCGHDWHGASGRA